MKTRAFRIGRQVWLLSLLGAFASLAGCMRGADGGWVDGYGASGGGFGATETVTDGGIPGDGAASATPMLAKIDPRGTLTQTPGQGVGVFTEYTPTSPAHPGGHWYVWWTCDTSLSGQSCPFSIEVSVARGAITNATSEAFGHADQLTTGNAETPSISATTTTTTTVQGVRFDTEPGAVITLSAALGGQYSGAFLFFVQDDQPNGGYKGTLTDPLEFQPTSP